MERTDFLWKIRHQQAWQIYVNIKNKQTEKIPFFVLKIKFLRGGRNVKFHYYNRPFFSEHWNCIFRSSLLRHQNVKSVFLVHHYIKKEKDHNVKSVFLVDHYYDKNQIFDVLILPMASKKITSKIKDQLPMAYYLWLPRPVGPWGVRLVSIRLG
jgi:hypothetical protein